MELTLPKENILKQLIKQLSNFFEITDEDIRVLMSCIDEVLSKCEYNFEHSDNKYYKSRREGGRNSILVIRCNICYFCITYQICCTGKEDIMAYVTRCII